MPMPGIIHICAEMGTLPTPLTCSSDVSSTPQHPCVLGMERHTNSSRILLSCASTGAALSTPLINPHSHNHHITTLGGGSRGKR
jgi:hypothetical protein